MAKIEEIMLKKTPIKNQYQTHHRQTSMEIKQTKTKSSINSHLKSTNNNNNNSSNLNTKEVLYQSNNNQNGIFNTNKLTKGQRNNSNIILNNGNLPCFNNINIYTTNSNSHLNNLKANNNINLKQYIYSKINNTKAGIKTVHTSSIKQNIMNNNNNNNNS